MFTDGRSRKVVLAAHCLLNQNSISDGTAVYPAAFREVVETLLDAEVGILQMPCPELCCLGLDRGNPEGAQEAVVVENTRIRREMQRADREQKLLGLVEHVMDQVLEYRRHGFSIVGIVGANRSPNCGVETTSAQNREVPGKGLFMEHLARRLEEEGLSIPMIGLKASEDPAGKVTALLKLEEGEKSV